jgi:hypothetical protein
MTMKLQFNSKEILALAKRCEEKDIDEDAPLEKIRKDVKRQQYLTKDQLVIIANWKSPRVKHQIAKNDNSFVIEVSKAAFGSKHPAFQIEVLTLLKGVGWPMASVILHFFFPEPFPIIDFRALYSIGREDITPQDYNFQFWEKYVHFFRKTLDDTGVDKRTLDRALWQYSYEKQYV